MLLVALTARHPSVALQLDCLMLHASPTGPLLIMCAIAYNHNDVQRKCYSLRLPVPLRKNTMLGARLTLAKTLAIKCSGGPARVGIVAPEFDYQGTSRWCVW